MRLLLSSMFLFLGLTTTLVAQKVHFSQAHPSAASRAELHQAYMEGNMDAVLEAPVTLTETGSNAPLELNTKLIETSSDFYPDFNSMGYYYLENQQLEEAKQAFSIYMTMAAQDPYAYFSMGEYYLETKEYDKAARYFDQATALGMERAQERATLAREEQLNSIVEEQKSGWE
ncbi:tetratricopeptide repeat protein [Lewinella sp. LCG006]|uniref:tetratricopeptide repeat protein n=1 Tax=Lewinella sp. LCG006 TaxID=3231911 RepID=UPI003460076F